MGFELLTISPRLPHKTPICSIKTITPMNPINGTNQTEPISSLLNRTIKYVTVLLIAIIAGATVYRDALISVFLTVVHREDSSHGVFVPFFALYFLWIKKNNFLQKEPKYEPTGILFFFLVLIITFFAATTPFQIKFFLYICLVLSVLFFFLGRSLLYSLSFPVLFLLTATPIPEDIYLSVANLSRTIALGASLKIIDLFGIPYFRNEWLVQLPTNLLQVNIGCSGIRYLISYVVFGIAYAYLFKTSLKHRLITVLCTFPLSITASTLRLTAIFTLSYYIDPRLAEHKPHVIISWIIFILIMLTAIYIDQKISMRQQKKS